MDIAVDGLTPQQVLKLICEEWDRAEADMKLAEQVGQDVIIPAVNELRYAGRRIIEAAALASTPGEPDRQKVHDLYRDARFFCHRARHDAIDAAVMQMVENIDDMMKGIGPAIIVQCFHDFAALRAAIRKVQRNIVESRKDRENREQIYKTVSECDFPALVELHTELLLSESIMLAVAKRARKSEFRNNVFGYGGLAFGAIGLLVGGVGIYLTYHPPEPSTQLAQPAPPASTGTRPAAPH